MASAARPQIPKWISTPASKEKLDYINLVNIDLAKFDDQESRNGLAREFFKAMTEDGFLTVSGHGISKETWDMQMDLANATMTMEPKDRIPYEVTKDEDRQGIYVGFKMAEGLGFHKEIDFYNMLLNDRVKDRKHPPHLQPYMDETRRVMLHVRDVVQKKLLILLAMCLELPEDELLATHAPGQSSSEYYRYVESSLLMSYSPLSPEAAVKARGLFMPAHADWGTFSILFSQPVCALQILHKSGVFKWVEYKPYTLIINIGQALELLTGGVFPATIHRVVTPPRDQQNALRVGIYYFSRPNDDHVLLPFQNSPLLERLGRNKPLDPSVTYDVLQFMEAKKKGYLKPELDFDRPRDDSIHSDPFRGGDTIEASEKLLTSVCWPLVTP